MRCLWSRRFVALGLLSLLALAGCGASGYGYGGSGGSSTASTSAGQPGAGIVATGTATVAGTSKTVLTDSTGRTLYHFDGDTATTSGCTGACATTWPPLLVSSGTPTSTSSLQGTLSASNVGNGQQVLYNGHPLYHYSGDAAPGDTHGDGIEGMWHVATPDLAAGTAPSGQPTQSSCSGPYCY